MKQFNLDEYLRLKGEGKEPRIVTRNGRNVRIICTDFRDEIYSIVALHECDEGEVCSQFTIKGVYYRFGGESEYDLFFADVKEEPKYRPFKDAEECFKEVKKHGGWVKEKDDNIYRVIYAIGKNGVTFHSFEDLLEDYIWADDKTPCGIKED